MHISLYSSDETLVGFCREILTEMFGTDWSLNQDHSRCPCPTDLCLWDYTSGGENILPDSLEPMQLRNHWFLVKRNDLGALQARLGLSGLNILLKPVSRSTLRGFLAGARARRDQHGDGGPGRMDELRVERDNLLGCLIQANVKLQDHAQDRSNFLARSLHDFRAPLTTISGYCGLLLESELGPLTPEQRQALERMHQSATRLSLISNAMFQLSVPQNPERIPKLEKVDVRDCVEQALHEVGRFVDEKLISITVAFEDQWEGLLFEKAQLEQILLNLLDNACKFTPRNGTIEIRGYPFFWERRIGSAGSFGRTFERRVRQSRVLNSFRIDIRDSGPGVSTTQAEKIFGESASYCGGPDRSGGGLGLAICRMILERHNGRIWAETSSSGAVFSFVIPLQHAEAGSIGGKNGADRLLVAGTLES